MADDTIYYLYEKATGNFGGSGITEIDDETYASTTLAPPDPPAAPVLRFDPDTQTWAWWVPVS